MRGKDEKNKRREEHCLAVEYFVPKGHSCQSCPNNFKTLTMPHRTLGDIIVTEIVSKKGYQP